MLATGRMGMADRDYHRREHHGGGFITRLTPVVKWLLIANLAVFFLDYLILPLVFDLKTDRHHLPPIIKWGAFSIRSAFLEFRVWEFLSFQFIHGSLGHVLFNSIGLYFFGPLMERWWGSAKFLLFYLLCGCAGAAFFTILTLVGVLPGGMESALVGASAGIYGIFIGVAVVAPDLRVALLFPPIELSMRQLAIALLVIASGAILLQLGGNEGGEAGHLGGAILGYILVRHPQLLGRAALRALPRHSPAPPKIRPRSPVIHRGDSDVDLILDKISREGFQSLTEAERETLQRAAQTKHTDS